MKRIKALLLSLVACGIASAQPISVNPPSGVGSTQTFAFNYNIGGGITASTSPLWVLINGALDGGNACYLSYNQPSGASSAVLYLVGNSGPSAPFAGSLTPSSGGSISNSQCTVSGLSVSTAGSDVVTVHLTITFLGGFSGKKIVYLGTTADGWHALGTWTVPGSPSQLVSATGMTPARSSYNPQATTASQFYSFTFNDSAGASSINKVNVLINNFVAGNAACYLAYFPSSQALYLVDDSGTGFVANPASGNSQCAIAAISSTASSQTLTVNLYVTFKSGLGGDRIAWTAATASNGQTPWQPVGTISVATPANGGHLYAGWIDTVGCNASHPITGWAMDLENPVSSPIVTVYVDGTATSTVATASNYRADLFADGIGSGYYGFSISSPSVLSSGTHTVAIYVGQIGTGVFLDGPSSCSPVRTGSPAVKQISSGSACPPDTYCAFLNISPTYNGESFSTADAYKSTFDINTATDSFGANLSITESGSFPGATFYYDVWYENSDSGSLAPGNSTTRLDSTASFAYLALNSSGLKGDFDLAWWGDISTSTTHRFNFDWFLSLHLSPPMSITNVTTNPSPLIAGQSGTVTFQGTGFGRAGTVTFSGPGSIPPTNYPAASYSASDTQFTIPVTPPSAGSYQASVQESVDSLGFGFQPAKKGQPPQATGTIDVKAREIRIFQDGTDVTNQNARSVMVGQPINLSLSITGGTIQLGTTWQVDGTITDGAGWNTPGSPTVQIATLPGTPSLTGAFPQTFYWVDRGSSRTVTAAGRLSTGVPFSVGVTFNVIGFDANLVTASALGTSGVRLHFDCGPYPACVDYDKTVPNGIVSGIQFESAGASPPGGYFFDYGWVQTVSVSLYAAPFGSIGTSVTCIETDGGGLVDTSQYLETQSRRYGGEALVEDAPGNVLSLRNSDFARSDSFTMTLMVKPRSYLDAEGSIHDVAGGIYVPVAKIPWTWRYNALAASPGLWYLDGHCCPGRS